MLMMRAFARQLLRFGVGVFGACLIVGGLAFSGQMDAFASTHARTNRDAAYPTASISGAIADASGNPITTKDVCVDAESSDNGSGYGEATTDASGNYDITGLAADSYDIYVYDCDDSSRNDLPAYYSTASNGSPTAIPLTAGKAQTAVDVQLKAATSISGHVYGGAGTSTPLHGACVDVFSTSSPYEEQVGYATTASDGSYTVDHLPPGAGYKVGFYVCSAGSSYASEFYDAQTSFADADTITPTVATPSTGIDAHLSTGGSISGAITDASGNPITTKDVCVSAYPISGGIGTGDATTDASGNYSIGGLSAGSYYVEFADCSGSSRNDVTQYYGDAPDESDSTLVVLSSGGSQTGINAQMAAATSISGRVYAGAGTGTPLNDICVNVQAKSGVGNDDDYYYYYSADTDSSGAYTIDHVAPITTGYTVEFTDCNSQVKYVSQYYGGNYDYATASTITPTVAAPASAIDAHLDVGGTINGTITDNNGNAITSGVCADTMLTGGNGAYYYGYSGQLTSSGSYSIGGLPNGTYDVTFYDCGQRNDVSQTVSNASVTLGQATNGINASMQPATSISGVVYGGAGNGTPLYDICVEALTPSGDSLDLSDTGPTDSDTTGAYTLEHLPPSGDYVVDFNTCTDQGSQYGSQYYDGVSELSQADVLTPTLAAPTTGIDAHLPSGAPVTTITGGPAANAATSQTDVRFSFTADQSGATFECALDGAKYSPCSSPYDTGTLAPSKHTFTVEATAKGLTETNPPYVTWTVDPSSATSTSQGEVSAGGTFSSDPGGQTSSSTPVIVDVTPPAGSQLTLTTEPSTTPSGNGYSIIGEQIDISAANPDGTGSVTGTVTDPIKLDFTLDASQSPAGTSISTITVTRNGSPAADCASSDGTANPDPCVESRTETTGGGANIVVLTTHCSLWNFAVTSTPVAAPVNTATPAAPTGSAEQGQTLTASTGAWTNSPASYSYQWEDCDSSGNNCQAISGATSSTYTLTSSDVGHTIVVLVTANNGGGPSTSASSAATAVVTSSVATVVVVAPAPTAPSGTAQPLGTAQPSSTAPPSISGTAEQGQTLTETHGTWTNNPTSYNYQWEDCDSSGTNCQAISGATSSTYTLTSSDVGHTIRVLETASNAGGNGAPSSSSATGVVQVAPGTSGLVMIGGVSVSGTAASVPLSCGGGPGATCKVTVALRVIETVKGGNVIAVAAATHKTKKKKNKKNVVLGTATVTLTAGQSETIHLSLNGAGQRLLAKYHTLKVDLTIAEAGAAESTGASSRTITFKSKTTKKKHK